MIKISDLRVAYTPDRHPALSIDSLTVERGERVAVIGPSGSGKTTLLRVLHGLVRPSAGVVTVEEVATSAKQARSRAFRARHASVFQEFQLVERASVITNVLCGRLGQAGIVASLFGRFGPDDRAAALAAIEATGLAAFADRRVDTLSGGQRQRVAVARALAQEPVLITADEPVSNLDPVIADDVLGAVMDTAARRDITAIAVVHHPALAAQHAERIIGMAEGRIVFDGANGEALDAQALRTIYGRSLPPQIIQPEDGNGADRDDVQNIPRKLA